MKNTIRIILLLSASIVSPALCQKGPARFSGDPILTDSSATLFIPIRYNEDFFSSNKIALWGDYYANILVYNFQTDTYHKVFNQDTFIASIKSNSYNSYMGRVTNETKNITSNWVFMLVKLKDTNKSGRIDEKDPSILFAISTNGKDLKQLTDESENVVSIHNYEKQGFMLIKIQRDKNNDKSFKNEDDEFYFKKLNLADLTLGKSIEVN